MKILNYGAGAVGLGIDSCLLKAGLSIDIIARENTAKALKENGLARTGIFGDFFAEKEKINVCTELSSLPSSPYDYILVSTKSFDSEFVAKDIQEHKDLINKSTKIILFQNGWGNAEVFASFLPRKNIYNARVITGFTRINPNEVEITVHADAIKIGSLFNDDLDALKPLCEAITKGDLPCEISNDISEDLWAKMLYNCALNPLGAILDVPYGVLAEESTSKLIMNEIISEIYKVLKATNHRTHWDKTEEYLDIFYSKLVPATAGHKSSTLQSLKHGGKTEIDTLTGAIINLAKEHNINVPANLFVYNIVKFIEKKTAGEISKP